MPQGSIIANVYTSDDYFPIKDATVSVTMEKDGKTNLIGYRKTNEEGRTKPIIVTTPDEDLSLQPGDVRPFTDVNIQIEHPDYYTEYVTDAQVFANTTSIQRVTLVPLKDTGTDDDAVIKYNVSPQNL